MNAGGEYYRIFTKDPNVHAFADLMNRALDKPTQQTTVTGTNDGRFTSDGWTTRNESIGAHRMGFDSLLHLCHAFEMNGKDLRTFATD